MTQTMFCRRLCSEEQVLKTPLSQLGPLSVSRRGNLRAELLKSCQLCTHVTGVWPSSSCPPYTCRLMVHDRDTGLYA